ncbi:hypothetical protein BH18ACT1_BH18ACT1_06130 [soil metagenome]
MLEDVRRLPELSDSTVAVRDAPDRLTAVGQTFRQEVRQLGRTFDSEWEVTALEPGRSLTIEGDVGYGVHYCLSERVEALGPERCRFGLRITDPLPLRLLGRLAGKLGVERRAEAETRSVVRGLERLVA